MLIVAVLSVLCLPIGTSSNYCLFSDVSGSSLFSNEELISTEPGSGRNVTWVSDCLFWKECPPGRPQRIVSYNLGEIFSREYFSGPSASGSNLIVSVPGEILIIEPDGSTVRTLTTGEYPGSICSDGETVWYVSSRDGVLKTISVTTEEKQIIDLPVTPLTAAHRAGLLLLGKATGGYLVTDTDGEPVLDIPCGFNGFFSSDNTVTFTRVNESIGCEALSWETVVINIYTAEEKVSSVQHDTRGNHDPACMDGPEAQFDVPYMHQKWDTPDWFNGSYSCGPTSCMMAVQYYNRLTPDSIWCSYPEGHWSEWGNYLPLEYTFLGETYDILGKSPDNVWVPGSHGFICRSYGCAVWAYMTLWMEQHGLDSSQLGTTWSACTSELSNSWPVVASTQSAYTGGHILLFNGYYSNHSVVCNDSYGDQNVSGWGTMPNGKDVIYDWPGYNNGNVELSVSQLFSARSEVLSPASDLIDDRTLGYRKLGPCQYWHEQNTGFDDYSWWTYSTGALPDTCVAEWTPELASEGTYLIETYVPASHAAAVAIYHINTSSGWQTATVNQNNFSSQWVPLGEFPLSPASAMVRSGDYTGTQGQYISFDAVRFTMQTSISTDSSVLPGGNFTVASNPVHSGSLPVFNLPEDFTGPVLIYDMTGRLSASVSSQVSAEILPPGLYHAVICDHSINLKLSTRFCVTE